MSKTKLQQLSPVIETTASTRVACGPTTHQTSGRGLRLLVATIALFTLAGLGTACSDDSAPASSGGFNDVPDVTLSGRILSDDKLVEIEVDVPNRHHAYLDAGEYGNLIPIAFEWQGAEPEPKFLMGPSGEQDDEVKAKVLRGLGRFVFEIKAEQIAQLESASPALRVRSQICDEDKGICYRPTWNELKL